MLSIAIVAIVLMILLKTFSDEDIGFGAAFVVSLVASIGTVVLANVLAAVMGIYGVLLATVIAAILLGATVSLLYGVEIKRAMAIGGIFILAHIGVSIGFFFMFSV